MWLQVVKVSSYKVGMARIVHICNTYYNSVMSVTYYEWRCDAHNMLLVICTSQVPNL